MTGSIAGARETRKTRAFEEKDSRRWLSGAMSAVALSEAGAASVTVVEDREGDIYECFACKPAAVEKLVRAAQDRRLTDETSLRLVEAPRLHRNRARRSQPGGSSTAVRAAVASSAMTTGVSLSFASVFSTSAVGGM